MCSKQKLSPREERIRLAGVRVTLSWPSDDSAFAPAGVTFLLPGAMISISEYGGLRDVVLQQNQLVVRFFINVLYPFRNNHQVHAEEVRNVFDALRALYPNLPNSYSMIGHSAGGKISLLVASLVDHTRVLGVLALDPVDLNPVCFTNERGPNLPLDDDAGSSSDSISPISCQLDKEEDFVHVCSCRKTPEEQGKVPIVLTCTDGGIGISKKHDADAIHKLHPATVCYHHDHAGHMAYCDHGGGWAGKLMPDIGTKEGNEKARMAAHDLIRDLLGRCSSDSS
mmetsp:Transcript_5244/g.11392  ORF Transcript_5244/g.11392 Transcript_5244/m.11392 type:complete len:282 (+) Transcript_5244:148-993(+)